MQDPKKVASSLLCLVVLSMGFTDYWEYSKSWHRTPTTVTDVLQGIAVAPIQYRVGVPYAANFLANLAHVGLRHTLTLIDVVAAFVAVFALFFLLRRSPAYRDASLPMQWFGAACFLFLVQMYLGWVTWYQRPETLTTAALVALTALLLTVRIPGSPALALALSSVGMVALAALQGFVRADVAFALHFGILLLCLTRAGDGMALPRWLQAGTSVVAAGVAAAIQFYLMHAVFPQARYGDTPVFQLLLNFKEPLRLVAFALFMPPYLWTMWMVVRRRFVAEAPAMALFAGSVVYLGMWWMVGRVEEVRIFLPFALAVAPMTAGFAMAALTSAKSAGAEPELAAQPPGSTGS